MPYQGDIDTKKWPYLKGTTFSKAHHFGYPAVSFSGVYLLLEKFSVEFPPLLPAEHLPGLIVSLKQAQGISFTAALG